MSQTIEVEEQALIALTSIAQERGLTLSEVIEFLLSFYFSLGADFGPLT